MVGFGSASMQKSRIPIREDQERNGSHGSGFEVLNLGEHVRVKLRIPDPGAPITYCNSSLGSGFEILLPTPDKILKLGEHHRIDREPGFLSSRPNRLPSPPYPQASVALPPLVPGGRGTFACGRGGRGNQFGRRDRHSGTLVIVKSLLYGEHVRVVDHP
jgi:hypothetical protein